MFHIICFSLENLRAKRYEHGCGTIIAQNGSGSKEVVAAGSAEERPDAETVEIYSVADSSWRYGTSSIILAFVQAKLKHLIYWSSPKNSLAEYLNQFSSTVNNLPVLVFGADSVPYHDSFILVGGRDWNAIPPLDTILLYNPGNDSWVEMPSKLKTPRYYPTVIPVRPSMFPSC